MDDWQKDRVIRNQADEIHTKTARIAELEAEVARLAKAWEAKHKSATNDAASYREYFDSSQKRMHELVAEVAKLERERNHFRDQQVEYAMQVNAAWEAGRDAAADLARRHVTHSLSAEIAILDVAQRIRALTHPP